MRIRDEEENDRPIVRGIVSAEFDTGAEADLIDSLRKHAEPLVSLVAEEDGVVVGHVMFSPVTLAGHPEVRLMGLAPLAVQYEHQRRGIGQALVREGIDRCRELGAAAVVALGHPEYYKRFGFVQASEYGLECEYDVPEEAFFALELAPGALSGMRGVIRYHAAFADL